MPAQDNDLLARLNALKPSSVTLQPAAPSIDVGTSKPQTAEDRLEQRLKILRSGGTPSKPKSADVYPTNNTDAVDKDPIRDWQQQDGDEQTLEELLEELGPDDQWKLDPEDPSHIESLLKEARSALPEEEESNVEPQTSAENSQTLEGERGNDQSRSADVEAKNEDQQDEEEAYDYVKKVLAELDFEARHGGGEPAQDEENDNRHTSHPDLNLPSTSADLPEASTINSPPYYEDSELEARFSRLGLGGLNLPSTPTSKPSSSKPKVTANLKSKSNLPKYIDDDIDSWCCICNEDGEVRCLGCDNDIYCQNCWQDGHGNGPGQERGHKAVQYNRRPPPAAA